VLRLSWGRKTTTETARWRENLLTSNSSKFWTFQVLGVYVRRTTWWTPVVAQVYRHNNILVGTTTTQLPNYLRCVSAIAYTSLWCCNKTIKHINPSNIMYNIKHMLRHYFSTNHSFKIGLPCRLLLIWFDTSCLCLMISPRVTDLPTHGKVLKPTTANNSMEVTLLRSVLKSSYNAEKLATSEILYC
jgi:hypothetical protein